MAVPPFGPESIVKLITCMGAVSSHQPQNAQTSRYVGVVKHLESWDMGTGSTLSVVVTGTVSALIDGCQ